MSDDALVQARDRSTGEHVDDNTNTPNTSPPIPGGAGAAPLISSAYHAVTPYSAAGSTSPYPVPGTARRASRPGSVSIGIGSGGMSSNSPSLNSLPASPPPSLPSTPAMSPVSLPRDMPSSSASKPYTGPIITSIASSNRILTPIKPLSLPPAAGGQMAGLVPVNEPVRKGTQ